ncbi:MAG: hypothetical protein AAGA99_06615 [Actinomycetota bacterium]
MSRIGIVAALLVVVAAVFGRIDEGEAIAVPVETGSAVGISPGGALLSLDDAEVRATMRDIAALGADWVRVDLAWPAIERAPGRLDWTTPDRIIGEARDAGLEVLALIGYTPGWAEGDVIDGRPEDPDDYGRFVATAAARYAEQVAAWELWNEPNSPVFSDDISPEGYAPLLAAGAAAVRVSDPSAIVVSGGLAPSAEDPDTGALTPGVWLARLVAASGGALPVDRIGIHPYSFPAFPDGDEPWNTYGRLDLLRATLDEAGVGEVPFWVTEFGAPTASHPEAVDEPRQGEIVVRGLDRARSRPDVDGYFVFALDDAHAVSGGDELSEGFGLRRQDGTAKVAYERLQDELGDDHRSGGLDDGRPAFPGGGSDGSIGGVDLRPPILVTAEAS